MNAGRRAARAVAIAIAIAAASLVAAFPARAATPLPPGVYGYGAGQFDAADTLHLVLNVQGTGQAARGGFTFVHQTPTGIFAHLAGDIDCYAKPGGIAYVTGTIRSGYDGLGIDPVGHRVSFAIATTGIRSPTVQIVDFDVTFVSGHTIAPCSSDPIANFLVGRGGFTVS